VFRLRVGDREEVVSVDRLKPHTGAEPVQPAAPLSTILIAGRHFLLLAFFSALYMKKRIL
jgi:hypothetical protein